MAQIPPNTTVASMLGSFPQCSIPCVLKDIFKDSGCPLTNAGELAGCACTNITVQSHFSTCVQKSCGFLDQTKVAAFASGLCEAYPKDSRVNELKTIAIVTIVSSVPFLFFRLYSRLSKTRRLWSDDVYAVIAAVFLTAVSAIILRMSLMGFGLHYWNVPVEHGVELLRLFYVCQMLYILVQVFSKVAILALYSRLLPDSIRWFQWSVRGMIAFMFIHGLVFFLMVVFQCWPINSIWDKMLDGKCIPFMAVIGFTGGGLSIIEDFIILLLPMHELWKLHMGTKKKVALVLLLSVGSFASLTSIIRLKYLLKYANTYDSTWDNVDVLKWSLIELLSACICGNLMPLRPLVDKIMPHFRSICNCHPDWSRKSSGKSSGRFGKISSLSRSRTSKKPKLISSLLSTKLSSSSGWDYKNSNANETVSPTAPPSAHLEKGFESHGRYADEEYAMDVPRGMIRKTSMTVSKTTQMPITESEGRGSDASERDLVQQRHVSGNWSRALGLFARR